MCPALYCWSRSAGQLNQVSCVQLLAFEAYRDLVKLHQGRLTDEEGIKAAQEENLSLRASALAAAQVCAERSADCSPPPMAPAQELPIV